MEAIRAVALAYRYPAPGSLDRLRAVVAELPAGDARRGLERFVTAVEGLELGEWEELHTATLDLSPHVEPYVGHVTWGENYRRGEFMADLNRAMDEAGVDLGGELPDHIEPVLRYLATVEEPLDDLVAVVHPAVESMRKTLDANSPKNPYRHVLAATLAVVPGPRAATAAPSGTIGTIGVIQ